MIAGLVAALVVTGVWWLGSQRHPTPLGELRDLYRSPVCWTAGNAPRRASPTVAGAWTRTTRTALAAARPLYHGDESIELHYSQAGQEIAVAFVRVAAHTWRPAQEAATTAWVTQACRSS